MAKKKRSAKGTHASPVWRLVLLLYAALYYRALNDLEFRSLEFLERLQDTRGISEYTVNYVFAFLCAAGLAILLFAPKNKRMLTGVGACLLLLPVWYKGPDTVGPVGAMAIVKLEPEPLPTLFAFLACLWPLTVVRGGNQSYKLVLSAALIGATLFLCRAEEPPLDWFELLTAEFFALGTGLAIDWAYNGIDYPSALPAFCMTVCLMLLGSSLEPQLTLYLTCALCAAGVILLLKQGVRKKDAGGALAALAGCASAALAALYMNGILL